MASNNQEIEVKFYITNLQRVQARLAELGAKVTQPRTHEANLRFDTPTSELAKEKRVLRLRQDSQTRLTYKGPGAMLGGTLQRQEIEVRVSDFAATLALLEALGYQVVLMYEKYRTALDLEGAEVSLDEMPFGSFIEIEGEDPETIRLVAQKLQLNWETRVVDSYTGIFEKLRVVLGFTFRDLSFTNFAGVSVTPADLNVSPADGG
jgi:adenylate cyclase class 2